VPTGGALLQEGATGMTRQDRRWLLGLFLGGLGLRLVHLSTIRRSPLFLYLGLDPLAYHEWALRIAAGDWLGQRVFYQDPLYPYFLGLLYTLLGDHRVAVTLVQLALGALVPLLVYDATRRGLGRAAAPAAGLLAAAYLPAIYFEGLILKTWLGAALVALALWCMACALTVPGWRRLGWLCTGITLGLGCLVRGNLLLVLPVLIIWRLAIPFMKSESPPPGRHLSIARRLNLADALALALGASLILFPTALRNRVVGGEWVMTTTQGGQNFYLGNNPVNTTGRYATLPFVGANPKFEEKGFTAEARRRTGRSMRPTEISRYWYTQSWTWMQTHPGDWLSLTWKKFTTYWNAFEVPDNLDYGMYRSDAPVLRLPLPGYGLVVPLALLGAILLSGRGGWPRGLLLFVAVYAGSVVLFFVFSRYRLAMMPALYPLAGYALADLARHLRRPGLRRALLLRLLILMTFTAGVHLPVHAHPESWAYRLAAVAGLPRRAESAVEGHYNLGLAFARYADESQDAEPMLRQALAQFEQATREAPARPQPYAEMGKALARLGEDRRAIAAFTTVISLEPGRSRPHHVLGVLYRRVGEMDRAATMFRRALNIDPDRLDSATALGDVLLAQGLRGDAATAYGQALRLQPGYAPAVAGLHRAGQQP